MEELQAQIDALKLEIEELKTQNAFCIDQVKKLNDILCHTSFALSKVQGSSTDCCNPVCRPA